MSDSRIFSARNLSLPELTTSISSWLHSENFDCQSLTGEDGATIIQIVKQGTWRKFLGMSTALNIVLRQSDANLLVEIGAGRWIDKAAAGTVSLFILWPLAVTAAVGTWQQIKMPERVFEQISNYIAKPRLLLVHLNPEKQKVQAATERVQVPSGVNIKVRRSRTIEHMVSIHWGISSEKSTSTGDKELWCETVRQEIEEKAGRSYKESETVEYEVELDGNKSHEYSLTWTDTLCSGSLEFVQGNKTEMLPFEFREQTELDVIPT